MSMSRPRSIYVGQPLWVPKKYCQKVIMRGFFEKFLK